MPHPLGLPEYSILLFLLVCRTARGSPTTVRYTLKKPVQIRTPTFACKSGIVCGSSERDGLCRTSKHIRDRVGETLELVRLEFVLIVDDVIVHGMDCALKTVVCL